MVTTMNGIKRFLFVAVPFVVIMTFVNLGLYSLGIPQSAVWVVDFAAGWFVGYNTVHWIFGG
jgi:hypothetical protein